MYIYIIYMCIYVYLYTYKYMYIPLVNGMLALFPDEALPCTTYRF